MKKATLRVRRVSVITNGATAGPRWAKLIVDGETVATGQVRYIRAKAKKLGFLVVDKD
jgi:hypothetical protein